MAPKALKRLKVGKRVQLRDPARIAVRFYSPDRLGILGVSSTVVPRESLDGSATVEEVMDEGMKEGTGTRGLIVFDLGGAMWVWANDCQSIPCGSIDRRAGPS